MRVRCTSAPPAAPLFLFISLLIAATASAQGTAAAGTAEKPAEAGSPVPCPELLQQAAQAPAEKRVPAYADAMSKRCRPLPAAFWTALRDGQWAEGEAIASHDRAMLLTLAMREKYADAETLVVRTVEYGRWPDGSDIPLAQGGELVRSLAFALTPYRVRLLLDVYEQVPKDFVRLAVVQTLASSNLDAAMLPVLDAYLEGKGSPAQAARGILISQPEKQPAGVLARLIRKLPQGPLLDWAVQLAEKHPSEPVDQARKERGV